MTDSSMVVIGDVLRREMEEILQPAVFVSTQTIKDDEKQKAGWKRVGGQSA